MVNSVVIRCKRCKAIQYINILQYITKSTVYICNKCGTENEDIYTVNMVRGYCDIFMLNSVSDICYQLEKFTKCALNLASVYKIIEFLQPAIPASIIKLDQELHRMFQKVEQW